MARKTSKQVREQNKPQNLKNRESKNKQSDREQKDKRDIFAEKMLRQLAAMKKAD
ncbi:hypothetical protein MHZ92_19975 [Sporosarcina sp. ACRSL]|uniref:hypothetical protein n=1 Tax=Sporosarcina sp. ACRSL TaxID=2918215 RepID=UPI001EF59EB6|nr:hypothetical protein [Sporosarcina sp. ACRSL]MCG7346387.1 hypothetical protein [Sporosarcina sp. ACRSL]